MTHARQRSSAHRSPPERSLTKATFIAQMAIKIIDADPRMVTTTALQLAAETLNDFLKEEHVEFGGPGFAWARGDADRMAYERQIKNWAGAL